MVKINFINFIIYFNSSNHALLRLLGKWKSALGSKKFNGAMQTDLSKVCDCFPNDLPIAK